MDNATLAILVIAIFALVALGAFQVFRRRAHVTMKGPLGTELEIDASNETTPGIPGVKIEDAKSRKGGLMAQDQTGRGVDVKNVKVDRTIKAISTPPPGQATNPKA
jgi:hypothetical protein